MTNYKAIGFDWGGVINGKPAGFSWKPIADAIGVSQQEFETAYYRHNQKFNKDEITARELWEFVFKELGHDTSGSELLDKIIKLHDDVHMDDVNQDIIGLLERLRANGYKLGLLSNNTAAGARQIRRLGMDKYFDVCHVSALTGRVKPNVEAFMYLADKLKVNIKELIFIDDTPKSLSMANEAGYTPILFKDYDQLLDELNALGVKTNL